MFGWFIVVVGGGVVVEVISGTVGVGIEVVFVRIGVVASIVVVDIVGIVVEVDNLIVDNFAVVDNFVAVSLVEVAYNCFELVADIVVVGVDCIVCS